MADGEEIESACPDQRPGENKHGGYGERCLISETAEDSLWTIKQSGNKGQAGDDENRCRLDRENLADVKESPERYDRQQNVLRKFHQETLLNPALPLQIKKQATQPVQGVQFALPAKAYSLSRTAGK